jgi:hypothetical protein
MIVTLRVIAALLATVCGGALAAPPAPEGEPPIDWTRARQHWAFRPPQAHRPPAIRRRNWVRQPLDAFILARLEQRRLAPSPPADARTLIRRVTFDLTGMPPTPEELEAFVAACRAEDGRRQTADGRERTSARRPSSFVRRLSSAASHPDDYTRLVDRLLASPRFGERLASLWLPLARYGEDQAHQVGKDTKFFYPNAYLYRQWVIDAFNRDLPYDRFVRLQLAADKVEGAAPADQAALGFIGLGPKYYNRNRLDVQADEWQDRVDTVTRTFMALTVACARCHDHKFDPITTHDYYALAGIFASTKLVNKTPGGAVEAPAEAEKLRKETLHVVEDDAPRDLNVFVRGNVENKGPVVPRRFLRVLSDGDPTPFGAGSGRKELAEAIASPGNPLTARVMVNRLWGLFFGAPLVGTPSNFGLMGDRPTHPELLDDLAVRFMKNGWSVKSLVREMVLSATYLQSSDDKPQTMDGRRRLAAPASRPPSAVHRLPSAVDPANTLLGRMNRRRLTAEQWRDSALFVAGRLEPGGGPSLELADPANHRRTVYARISRLKLDDMLVQFDYPDANVHAEKRSVTTTPVQKLFLLNSPFMLEQARALATRVTANPGESNTARVRRAYLLLYSRPPSPEETRLALAYLDQPEAGGMSRWERYAQVLLMSNEFSYVD